MNHPRTSFESSDPAGVWSSAQEPRSQVGTLFVQRGSGIALGCGRFVERAPVLFAWVATHGETVTLNVRARASRPPCRPVSQSCARSLASRCAVLPSTPQGAQVTAPLAGPAPIFWRLATVRGSCAEHRCCGSSQRTE